MSVRRTLLLVASVVLAVGNLSGCGGDDRGPAGADASTLRPGTDPEENANVALRYFEAVASNDADLQADGLEFAAPDSPAAAYLTYLADSSAAFEGAGEKRRSGALSAVPGGYRICSGGSAGCARFSALTLADGRVNDFTVGGARILRSTVLGGGKVVALGRLGTVEFRSRTMSAGSDTFVVNLHVTSGDLAITLESGTAAYQQGAGARFRPVRAVGPAGLGPDSEAFVMLVFQGPERPSGRLRYAVTDATGAEEVRTLRLS